MGFFDFFVANIFLAVAFVFGELRGQIATRITLYGREVFDENQWLRFIFQRHYVL